MTDRSLEPDADRIAELERRLAILDGDASMGDFLLSPEENRERVAIRAELSRLSNEQPEGGDAALTQWRREPTCFYDGETRPVGNNADEWQVFMEHWLDVRDGRVHGTSFVCVQIAEAIDAAEKRGCVFASLAPSPAPSPEPQDVREALGAAIAFIVREYHDPALEPEGEWLPPEARKVHAKLVAALAQFDAQPCEPDDTKVICPNCTHQFTAISVADQARLRAQSAQPVGWPEGAREALGAASNHLEEVLEILRWWHLQSSRHP